MTRVFLLAIMLAVLPMSMSLSVLADQTVDNPFFTEFDTPFGTPPFDRIKTDHYRPAFDVVTLHSDPDGRDHLADTLVHEAAHQMIEQRIYGHGHPGALWITEGLASYFGYTYMDAEGVFHTGEVGGKADSLMRGKPRPSVGEGRVALRNARKAMKAPQAEDGLLFAHVVSITDPGIFYGEAVSSNYAASWLVVHFLMHGDEGRHRDDFIRYLEKEARGEMGEESLFSEIRMPPRGLEEAVIAHTKKLKAR